VIVSDTIRLAFRNLGEAKLRTALTTLGVSIGIASLAGMVSLGVGLEDQLIGRFMQSGLFDAITVTPGGDIPGVMAGGGPFGRGRLAARGRRGGASGSATPAAPDVPPRDLNDDAIRDLAALDGVREVYPVIRVPIQIKFEQAEDYAMASGVPLSAKGEGPFQKIPFGTFFVDESSNGLLLSLEMAKRLTDRDPKDLIGKDVTVTYASGSREAGGPGAGANAAFAVQQGEMAFKVIGIVERETGPVMGAGISGVMLPLARAKELYAKIPRGPASIVGASGPEKRQYVTLTVKVKRADKTLEVQDRIKSMGFSAFSLQDALQGAKRAFLILDIVLSLIGSIALAVSSLGIVNTMVMSILERTREIGIMKAIGGSDVDVRRIFLVEASAIGILGGAAGVALGWLVGRIINFFANLYIANQGGTPGNLFSLPFWLVAGAIGFSWLVSLVAGSYPASRAAKLDPIQALRHD